MRNTSSVTAPTLAMYTQNFMIIRRLLEIKEQNQQIIELLTEIKNK